MTAGIHSTAGIVGHGSKFVECGLLDMSTPSHSSVQCDVAVMTFGLARSLGNEPEFSRRVKRPQQARQGTQTDVQYFTPRHTHLHHRSTWVWWAAAWQRCTLFSPPHTTPQRSKWLPSLWSACPWTHKQRENVKIESLCISWIEIKRSFRVFHKLNNNIRNSFTINEYWSIVLKSTSPMVSYYMLQTK